MRWLRPGKALWSVVAAPVFLLIGAAFASNSLAAAARPACPGNEDTGLKLPAGFCATIFADKIGHARHLVVSPSGVVYVNTWSGRYYPANDVLHEGGFLVALKDQKGTGHADLIQRFGETVQTRGEGGTGIALQNNSLYVEINDRIVKYTLAADQVVPQGAPVTIVSGFPNNAQHPMHPFFIGEDGFLYVELGSATNSCQLQNRAVKSPGIKPCVELQTRAGIWRYDANKPDQKFSAAERYATGIRNAEGFAIDTIGHRVFVTQHGRDELHTLWPALYKPEQEATLPAEEVLLLQKGGDYGWPECYYDPAYKSLVLAPEYGGDGKTIGSCAGKIGPFAAYPAHWAPLSLAFYNQKQFPARYQNGLFIAFHGSWNRAPYSQQGYNVVFQSLATGQNPGRCEIFADGFAGAQVTPEQAAHRPTGLAVGPDGSLYVSDDTAGRIYKIVYRGDTASSASAKYTACPSLTSPAGPIARSVGEPLLASLPVPEGKNRGTLALGSRIYRGEVGGAACTGCHGANGKGTPLGPDLTVKTLTWSDGSYAGIARTIAAGVPQPKHYRSPMLPMGGAQLTADQASALAAYVWALSH
jgi:glucose/arabinose dehydrogenase/mono/diheme cytochrome c family protein